MGSNPTPSVYGESKSLRGIRTHVIPKDHGVGTRRRRASEAAELTHSLISTSLGDEPIAMTDPVVLVVGLWIAPGQHSEFERFEADAFSVIAQYGGTLVRRVALRDGAATDPPDEVHVVTFPSRAAYESYRADSTLASLAAQRAKSILRTVIWEGVDLPPFGV